MKNLFIIFILSIAALNVYGQTRHYTLSECDNDPLKYIEKNYEQNKARYIEKTIKIWVDECQIKLGEVIPFKFSPWEKDKSLIGKVELVSFPIYLSNFRYSIYIEREPLYIKLG